MSCSRPNCDSPRWFPWWHRSGFRRCESHQRLLYPGTVR